MTSKQKQEIREKGLERVKAWRADWPKFAREALGVNLDPEMEEILRSVQKNPRTTVASGTARGKDFLAAVAAICFMYLTPTWKKVNKKNELIGNTKVALTAPTDRQVKNIMMPEISRLFNRAKSRGVTLPGRLNVYDIRTQFEEWFLTGFKADEHQHEAWSGFHAVNTMFVITEASGISDDTFGAIEGNLQGNSRILIVFNPNVITGYAAKSQRGSRWSKFRLNSLTAPNVKERKQIIPGQVDHVWIEDKIAEWCTPIRADEVTPEEDDFEYPENSGEWYRPEDIFRIKVLGKFPKVSEDALIPRQWIEIAQKRWVDYHNEHGHNIIYPDPLRLGVDVAGMGRDSSVFCYRYGTIVSEFFKTNSGGKADHMKIAGRVVNEFNILHDAIAIIDTIGEGAGVYSRLDELSNEIEFEHIKDRYFSCKFSTKAVDEFENPLTDVTGQYRFENKRAYLFWAVRDWLNPKNGYNPMLPPGDDFADEATEIRYFWKSNGSIMIEPKDDIKKRLGKSTDLFDALANTFENVYFSPYQDYSKMM